MEKKQKESKDNPYRVFYDNYTAANAGTECTGLMYRPAEDAEAWAHYHEVFDFSPKPPDPKKQQID